MLWCAACGPQATPGIVLYFFEISFRIISSPFESSYHCFVFAYDRVWKIAPNNKEVTIFFEIILGYPKKFQNKSNVTPQLVNDNIIGMLHAYNAIVTRSNIVSQLHCLNAYEYILEILQFQ